MSNGLQSIRIVLAFAAAFGAFTVFAATPPQSAASVPAKQAVASGGETGLAAVYSDRLNGRRTASGRRYHRNALTTAHKTLPFGMRVKVTNARNGKSVELTVNDRGPRQADRVLDISPAAAKKLGISRHGIAQVSVEVVGEAPVHHH